MINAGKRDGAKKYSGRRPNILLLFSDEHKAGALHCAGNRDVITPNLDALAAGGIRFERAYCQNGQCVPSRVSMLTGRYPHETGVFTNADQCPNPSDFPPFQIALKKAGYATAAFGKRHVMTPELDSGWDESGSVMTPQTEEAGEYYVDWVRKQGDYEAYRRDWKAEWGGPEEGSAMCAHVSQLRPENTMAAYAARRTIEFIKAHSGSAEPFFCWCSFHGPHQPYTPPAQYANLYDEQALTMPDTIDEPPENLPPLARAFRLHREKPWCLAETLRNPALYRMFLRCYYGMVTEIDHHVGLVLKALEETGLRRNTLIVYASDHGDYAGAHGLIEKTCTSQNVYEDILRIPFMANWPGMIPPGRTAPDLVELADLYPTLLEITGLAYGGRHALPGISLAPRLLDEPARIDRRYVFSENDVQAAVVNERYKLGVWRQEQSGYPDMLFDLANDPGETRNLIGRPETAAVESGLRARLASFLGNGRQAGVNRKNK